MAYAAVQQIQLGSVMNRENEAEAVLARAKAAGLAGIELNGFMIRPISMPVKMLTRAAGMPVGNGGKLDWHGIIRRSGMLVPSLHLTLGEVEKDPQAAAKEALSFGAQYITITAMYRYDYRDPARVHELAKRLDAADKKLKAHGVRLLYHNHNIEFIKPEPGKTVYDILMDETHIGFEFDSYWAVDAGADAAGIMETLGDRLRMYHINDRGCRLNKTPVTPILKMDSMELGCGNLDLDRFIRIARQYAEAIIIESHRNFVNGNPVKSMEISAKFLTKKLGENA